MSTEDQIITERKQKLEQWRKLGFDYAAKFDRTHTSAQAHEDVKKKKPRDITDMLKKPQSSKSMCGRIMNLRDMGKLSFLRLRDNDGDFQICFAKDVLGEKYKTFLKILDLGDFCGFEGEFFVTKHGEPTLLATKITPLAKTLRPLPEKFHGLTDREACYRQRYLDLLSNPETSKRFQIRSQIVREIRNFLENKNFEEIETRTLQPQAGGAMAKVFETHHNAFNHEFVLRIALELDLKIAVGGGLERVFEIGKCFRNEGTDPSHLQEFTMLEWYAAYKNMDWNMKLTEDLVRSTLKKVLGKTKITVLDKNEKKVEIDFGKKFKQERFPDLLEKYAKINMFKAKREEMEATAKSWGIAVKEMKNMSDATLLDNIYKKSARPNLLEPTFVCDYPSELKPLARPHGNGTAECFQLLVAGWEIVNSYGELIDPQVQRALLEDQAKAKLAGDEETMDVDEEFLTAMEHGMPPMTGFGMGIDRFVTLITEQLNLRDTVLFPLMKPEGIETNETGKAKDTLMAVALLNSDLKLKEWEKMNTIAHLNAAFAARKGKSLLMQDTISTKDNKHINLNIQHAIMIKTAGTKDLTALPQKAKSAGLDVAEFIREMIETTDDRKVVEWTEKKNFKDIEYLGVLIFGKKSAVEILTKKFPLVE